MRIIRGTTPSLIYTFNDIQTDDLVKAYLIVTQNEKKVIEKELSDAIISEGKLIYTFSQSETLSLSSNVKTKIILDWKTSAGLRGRANVYEALVENSGKEEVI